MSGTNHSAFILNLVSTLLGLCKLSHVTGLAFFTKRHTKIVVFHHEITKRKGTKSPITLQHIKIYNNNDNFMRLTRDGKIQIWIRMHLNPDPDPHQ